MAEQDEMQRYDEEELQRALALPLFNRGTGEFLPGTPTPRVQLGRMIHSIRVLAESNGHELDKSTLMGMSRYEVQTHHFFRVITYLYGSNCVRCHALISASLQLDLETEQNVVERTVQSVHIWDPCEERQRIALERRQRNRAWKRAQRQTREQQP